MITRLEIESMFRRLEDVPTPVPSRRHRVQAERQYDAGRERGIACRRMRRRLKAAGFEW